MNVLLRLCVWNFWRATIVREKSLRFDGLSLEVRKHPSSLSLLDGFDVELGQFVLTQGATDRKRQTAGSPI
jgi:hypothetical protein